MGLQARARRVWKMRLLTKNRPRSGVRGAWGSWVPGPPRHRALDTRPDPRTSCTRGVLTRAPLRCSPGVLHGPALRVPQPLTARNPGSSPGWGVSLRTRPRVGAQATWKRTKQLSCNFHTPGTWLPLGHMPVEKCNEMGANQKPQ